MNDTNNINSVYEEEKDLDNFPPYRSDEVGSGDELKALNSKARELMRATQEKETTSEESEEVNVEPDKEKSFFEKLVFWK